MGLFNKKLSLEEILKGIESLSEEEKAMLKEKMQEEAKPVEEETEATEPVEETSTEEPTSDGEEVVEETEEVEETAEEPVEEVSNEENIEESNVETTEEATTEPEQGLNQVEENNQADIIQQMTDRLSALEEKFATFEDLKAKMEEFTQKQADKFGYKGSIPGAKKDYKDMSADELSKELRTEI